MNNFRKVVFERAHKLAASTGKAFNVCLSKAWSLYRLAKRMSVEVVRFTYEKADGTLRTAKGTLKEVSNLVKGTGAATPQTFKYFDIDAKGFRCFKIENLISIF